MSKYPFFAKRGRPSKIEKDICVKINQLINSNQVKQSDIDSFIELEGSPETGEELEKLYSNLIGESPIDDSGGSNSYNEDNIENNFENIEDYSDSSSLENDEDIINTNETNGGESLGSEAIDFDPFNEPVVERGYTQGNFTPNEEESNKGEGVEFDNTDFEQPDDFGESVADEIGGGNNSINNDEDGDIPDVEYIEEDIPEPEWSNTIESETDIDEAEFEEEKEPLGGDNLQDLSPAQKRKSAEKTADAILDMYCNFAPLPFKKWASFKDNKIQKMVLNDQINLNMQLENGVTVKDFIDGTNEQVDEIFAVDDDTRESIKDPLIDVLLEQEIALTPTQRLLMAVGSHVVTMGFSAYQLSQNNKQALETFTKFHKDMKDKGVSKTSTQHSSKQTAQEAPINYAQEFTDHDNESVKDIMKDLEGELNKDDDGIIDAEHDPNVTVEEIIIEEED